LQQIVLNQPGTPRNSIQLRCKCALVLSRQPVRNGTGKHKKKLRHKQKVHIIG
jgi:hypothetical protein